jgi:exonuclease SbcD
MPGRCWPIYGIPWLEPRLVAEQLGVDTASHFEVTRAATERDPGRRTARASAEARIGPYGGPGPHLRQRRHQLGQRTRPEHRRRRRRPAGPLRRLRLHRARPPAWPAGPVHGGAVLRLAAGLLLLGGEAPRRAAGSWTSTGPRESPPCVQRSSGRAPEHSPSSAGRSTGLLEAPDALRLGRASAYCQVTLTDAQRPAQAMERLRARFPDTLVLGFEPEGPRRLRREL